MATIILIFLCLGVFLPYINADFNNDDEVVNVEGFTTDIGEKVENASQVSAFTVIFSVFKMFFWTFGSIPFWIDLTVIMTLRIVLVVLLARNIWIGGGG